VAEERVGPNFKRLTEANWREPDLASEAFGEINLATGERRPMTAERWVQRILAVGLSEDVPAEVKDLCEVARGVLLYGYFFYPLYMLGDEQLHRVAARQFCTATASWAARRTPELRIRRPSAAVLSG
jgi:hypothetical protein